MANKNFPHAGKSTEINAIQENRNFENRNNENRDYLEETAAEAGAVESRNTNETYNYNNDADEAGGRNLGWLALALSIISLFVLPVLLVEKMPKTLAEIKKDLDSNLGKRLVLRANGGRRKTIERSGILAETYPSVFVVELDQDENAFERVSYSYADILTKTVQITFFDDKKESV